MTNRNHDHFRDLTKMVEYISRSDAIEAIKNDALEMVYYGKEEAIECLGAVPRADVRPAVRGEWKTKKIMIRTPAAKNYVCSVCGEEGFNTNFCPNCGADMRGKRA